MFKRIFLPNPELPEPVLSGNATFAQYIDHQNPDLGTFEQFYYYGTEFWKGPGSPIILMTPGETNVTGYQSYLGYLTLLHIITLGIVD